MISFRPVQYGGVKHAFEALGRLHYGFSFSFYLAIALINTDTTLTLPELRNRNCFLTFLLTTQQAYKLLSE